MGGERKNTAERSWFVVFNNPQEHGYEQEPQELCELLVDKWVGEEDAARSAAAVYCVSAKGLKHVHLVLEDKRKCRFSAVQKLLGKAHIEATKGDKKSVEDYINKKGKFEEKGEIIVAKVQKGEIHGKQGKRTDIEQLYEMVQQNCTISDIRESTGATYYKYQDMVRRMVTDKIIKDTPAYQKVNVVWDCGMTGSGKSWAFVEAVEEMGEEKAYKVTDYGKGMWDAYSGHQWVQFDEFRPEKVRWGDLMQYLDGYKVSLHARYSNAMKCYKEIHISTVMAPSEAYNWYAETGQLVGSNSIKELFRRISIVRYHYKVREEDGSIGYRSKDYTPEEFLSCSRAAEELGIDENGFAHEKFEQLPDNIDVPFSDDFEQLPIMNDNMEV